MKPIRDVTLTTRTRTRCAPRRHDGVPVPPALGRRDYRARGGVLHDGLHAHLAHRAQPKSAEGVQSQSGTARRRVRRAYGRPGRHRYRGDHPAASHQHAIVANVRAERGPVPAGAAGRLVERPDPEAGAVHAAAADRRTAPECRSAGVRLLLPAAAHGGGRTRRDYTDSAHRRSDHDDHDHL